MVATTFAADTPLAVTEMVAKNGIAGNWLWWNFAFGGMLTVFFFAKLWRRANIVTELEFIQIRYDGKSASFLRAFKSIYFGLLMNCIIIAWVNIALVKIICVTIPTLSPYSFWIVGLVMLIVAIYSSISGQWGIAITDVIQFIIAMTGCIVLAIIVISSDEIGGIDGLKNKLPLSTLSFFPTVSDNPSNIASGLSLNFLVFIGFIGIQWWASWYPGAEPGGGGYVVQRMLSTKNEKHSTLATLWFTIAHYCVRPWPWILVGLSSIILYPDLADDQKGNGFIMAMNDFLPPGLLGLLMVAFLAAYMSTIATHLNWGTSYIINDLYKPFIANSKNEQHYVNVSKVITLLIMIIGMIITSFVNSIVDVWTVLLQIGSGIGLVLILRWFWWRINAWAEISAMFGAMIVASIMLWFPSTIDLMFGKGMSSFPMSLYVVVPIVTIIWVFVMYLTKPVSKEKLHTFYELIHPGGFLWKKVSRSLTHIKSDSGYIKIFLCWLIGVLVIYGFLFGMGKLIFGDYTEALIYLSVALIGFIYIFRTL
jgi:solute:Na+ symporter, SSS family